MTLPKYLKRQLDERKYPTLVVQKDKYNTYFYLANNREELLKVFLNMLENNWKSEYYYKPNPPKLKDQLTEEQIVVLPEKYQKTERAIVAENARVDTEYALELEQYMRIKKALDTRDGELAFQVLSDRKDYEYEVWRFETLEEL